MNVTDTAEIIAMARDIVFLALLLVLLLVALVLFLKVSSVMRSVKRTIRDAEEMVSTVSGSVVRPAAAGSGIAFGAGKILAFMFGLRRRRKKKGGNNG